MTNPLVECIPNFSEGRNPDIVEKIVHTITGIKGITLLNQSSDVDHNRTVVSFMGPPAAVEEAAFQGIKIASKFIDLNRHSGTHPRIGATDVVPFVPISGVDMQTCIDLSRSLGERVGRELDIPVYLYEEAATSPERKNLENIRRGQYEALKDEIISNPERKPDFGPLMLGTAGATVIGARHPLIAFNVYLDSDDVSIAKEIARKIRTSSGGLPCVKALGMLVDGRAQVSMNLTNFRITPMAKVVSEIGKEAKKKKTQIHHSELVGLIPQEALVDTAIANLQLEGFQQDQILENHLFSPEPAQNSEKFLDELAASTATPGGGAAAAYTGAMSAALVSMVARLTIGKKKYTQVEPQMKEILIQAERLRKDLFDLVEKDSKAFNQVMDAFKLPKDTASQEAKRIKAIDDATIKASKIPLTVAQKSVSVMALAERCVSIGNINAISDGASAGSMAQAAIISAGYNVRINVFNLSDKKSGEEIIEHLQLVEKKSGILDKEIHKTLRERGGIITG